MLSKKTQKVTKPRSLEEKLYSWSKSHTEYRIKNTEYRIKNTEYIQVLVAKKLNVSKAFLLYYIQSSKRVV